LEQVVERELLCLGTTVAGHPRHPLYVPYAAKLLRYQPEAQATRNQYTFACASGW
jgi:hypothetical protein